MRLGSSTHDSNIAASLHEAVLIARCCCCWLLDKRKGVKSSHGLHLYRKKESLGCHYYYVRGSLTLPPPHKYWSLHDIYRKRCIYVRTVAVSWAETRRGLTTTSTMHFCLKQLQQSSLGHSERHWKDQNATARHGE